MHLQGQVVVAPINIFKSLLKMSYILKKWQAISKKFENLTLPLWRPIEQRKIRRTIFQCVFYFIVCKPEYIVSHYYHSTLYYQNNSSLLHHVNEV